MWAAFGFFFSTGHVDQCCEDDSAGGALHAKTNILSIESDQLSSDAGLNADSLKSTFNLMSPVLLGTGLETFTNPTLLLHVSLS